MFMTLSVLLLYFRAIFGYAITLKLILLSRVNCLTLPIIIITIGEQYLRMCLRFTYTHIYICNSREWSNVVKFIKVQLSAAIFSNDVSQPERNQTTQTASPTNKSKKQTILWSVMLVLFSIWEVWIFSFVLFLRFVYFISSEEKIDYF